MVASKPNLRNVVKFTDICDFFGVDVAMLVDDRHFFGVVMIQSTRSLVGQKEIFIHKSFHVMILHILL